jgi:hypothetical protein
MEITLKMKIINIPVEDMCGMQTLSEEVTINYVYHWWKDLVIVAWTYVFLECWSGKNRGERNDGKYSMSDFKSRWWSP